LQGKSSQTGFEAFHNYLDKSFHIVILGKIFKNEPFFNMENLCGFNIFSDSVKK